MIDYSLETVSLVSTPSAVQLTFLALTVGELKYLILYLRKYSIPVRNLLTLSHQFLFQDSLMSLCPCFIICKMSMITS